MTRESLSSVTNQEIEKLKAAIVPSLKEAGVKRSAVFGSLARGEYTSDSDVDLLIELERDKSLLDFIALKNKLEEVLKKKVDLVEYKAIKPRLKAKILEEQIAIL